MGWAQDIEISVQSYLKIGETFTPIEDFSGIYPRRDYIDGAIQLQIGQTEILSLRDWDNVDELWHYICDGLVELKHGRKATISFPDQPRTLVFEPVKNDAVKAYIVNEPNRSAVADRNILLREMADAATKFFNVAAYAIPGSQFPASLSNL